MKYFTKELWEKTNLSTNSDELKKNFNEWDIRFENYYKQLELISNRLGDAYKHFSKVSFHDFRLEKMELLHNRYYEKPALQIRLIVTDDMNDWVKSPEDACRYELFFEEVIGLDLICVKNNQDNCGLDEWGYEEILAVDGKTLSFEVLFTSGANLYITFPDQALKVNKL